MSKRNQPDDKGSDPTSLDGSENKHIQQEDWGELYRLDATESYSTEDYSDSSDEDEFDINSRYLRVKIENEGETNKNKINFFPKTNMRRFSSSVLLNQQIKTNSSTNQEEHFTRADSAPILRPAADGALPAFLANRIRNAELVVGEIPSNGDSKTNSLQSTTVQSTVGPATEALKQEDPRQVYSKILEKHGLCSSVKKGEELGDFFIKMGQANVTGYTMDIVAAVRSEDVDALRTMNSKGQTLQVCNRFGESIIHSACRRGLAKVLRFLVDEARVSLAVKDDYGKTPAHDACWTIKPNFEVVKIVVMACPDLLLIADKRGSTPLDYTQRSLWSDWCVFLKENEDILIPKQLKNDLKQKKDT